MVSKSKLFPSNAANSNWFRPYLDDDDGRNLKTVMMVNNSQQQQQQHQLRRSSDPIHFHSTGLLYQHSQKHHQRRRWSNSESVYQQPQTRDDDNADDLSPSQSQRLSFTISDASKKAPQSSPRSITAYGEEMNESCQFSNRVTSVNESGIDVGTILGTGGFCVVRLACLQRNRAIRPNVDLQNNNHAPTLSSSSSSSSSSLQRMFAMKYLSPTKFAPESYKTLDMIYFKLDEIECSNLGLPI